MDGGCLRPQQTHTQIFARPAYVTVTAIGRHRSGCWLALLLQITPVLENRPGCHSRPLDSKTCLGSGRTWQELDQGTWRCSMQADDGPTCHLLTEALKRGLAPFKHRNGLIRSPFCCRNRRNCVRA